MQGIGGIFQMDTETYKKILSWKVWIPETKDICEAITSVCNALAGKLVLLEITAPMRVVRLIAIYQMDGVLRPSEANRDRRNIKESNHEGAGYGYQIGCQDSHRALPMQWTAWCMWCCNEGCRYCLPKRNDILLMDAHSALYNLSRSKTLVSVSTIIPDTCQLLRNLYCPDTTAYYNGKWISIDEGILQGWSPSNSFYDGGIKQLVEMLRDKNLAKYGYVTTFPLVEVQENSSNGNKKMIRRNGTRMVNEKRDSNIGT